MFGICASRPSLPRYPPALARVARLWLLLVLVALVGVFIAPSFAAQRLVLPELVGENETVVAQANAVFEGVLRATGLLGPITAGS